MRCKTFETSIFNANGDSLPGPRILVFFTWNLDSGFQSLGGSGFLELSSEFQSPLFLILQTTLYWIQIPQAKITWIPESTFLCTIPETLQSLRQNDDHSYCVTLTTSKTILAWAIHNFQMQYIVQCSRFKGSLGQG